MYEACDFRNTRESITMEHNDALRDEIRQNVNDFLDWWMAEQKIYLSTKKSIPLRDAEDFFGDLDYAKEILREQGFTVSVIPAQKKGFLWWRRETQPAKWQVEFTT